MNSLFLESHPIEVSRCLKVIRNKQLEHLAIEGKIPQSMIIYGNSGVGKSVLAAKLAKIILGEGHAKLFDELSHPDLFFCESRFEVNSKNLNKKRSFISVDDVREALEFSHKTPAISKNKVIIFDDISYLAYAQQAALLKTIEEPTENTYIIMVCSSIHLLQSTVSSRAIKFYLSPPKFEEYSKIVQDLLNKKGVSTGYEGALMRNLHSITSGNIRLTQEIIRLNIIEKLFNIEEMLKAWQKASQGFSNPLMMEMVLISWHNEILKRGVFCPQYEKCKNIVQNISNESLNSDSVAYIMLRHIQAYLAT